jgi:hypothetical protein
VAWLVFYSFCQAAKSGKSGQKAAKAAGWFVAV